MSFVERHGLWSAEQKDAAAQAADALVEEHDLEVIRFSFPDQHGILRGKTLIASEALRCLESGCTITTTMFAKDTSHKTVFPVFTAGGGFGIPEMQGAADVLMIPDPLTFRVLPWAPHTGWLLCDVHFADGRPVPFATRNLYKARARRPRRRAATTSSPGSRSSSISSSCEEQGWRRRMPASPARPPEVSLLSHGYQYLTEQRYDQMEPVLEIIRRDVSALGLPLRSVEVEYGPSQCEFTFQPTVGLTPADNMVLFRSAVKQICHRRGYHATFMCRPKLPNVVSSGWHLHQSLVSRDGANAFMSREQNEALSPFGRHYLAGLLTHARAATVFTTPTINGYKRYRSYSLAPDRAIWGRDNRGAMIRVLGGPFDAATRLENRVGEPAANPYLYMSSQILAGLDGVDRALDPGPSADTPYESDAPLLPKSLREAVFALKDDPFFRTAMGSTMVDYYTHIKLAEIERFQSEVSDWEQREYFEMF